MLAKATESARLLRLLIGAAIILYLLSLAILLAQVDTLSTIFRSLKDWQILIASLLAFGAASIAYKAAMAKVGLDRELSEQAIFRTTLSLYLRLSFVLEDLEREAVARERLARGNLLSSKDRRVSRSQLEIVEVPEIEEAWASLNIFPPAMTAELRTVRNTVRKWKDILKSYLDTDKWEPSFVALEGNPTNAVADCAKTTHLACRNLVSLLDPEIARLRSISKK